MSIHEGADVTHQPRRTSYNDVFISFCHEDSYFGFLGDLYKALQDKSIQTYRGEAGDSEEIEGKIEESWISIVVLSTNYASHTQCLDQLVRILECKKKMNQIVYPIYYEVDRSDVRELKGVYGEAMAKHMRMNRSPEIVQKWSSALAEVAHIPGFDLKKWFEKQDELIQRIVELVYKSLSRYDVFISFEGHDTGYTFTGNLYNALRRKKIKTFFIDDKLWKKQDSQISSSFLKAIEESRISIVVLSKSYAKSTWCLDELTSIIEGKNTNNQLVLPIFYKVKPSHVRRQQKQYKVAMNKQERRLGENCDKVHKWKKHLTEVANLTGVPLVTGYEYEHIEKIVESTLQSLSKYDVFLSFSREDTGHSFARYLYNVLCQSGFKTFMDDVGIGNEDHISHTLTKVIDNSKHSIIIFSKNYAYSWWCLDEIVKILECCKKKNHMIWPIFHNVQLVDVRYQKNSYADAMSTHEKRYIGVEADRVKKWKSALHDVTYQGGYAKAPKSVDNFVQTEHDTELVKKIVEHLSLPDSELWPVEVLQPHSFMSTSGFISGSQHTTG